MFKSKKIFYVIALIIIIVGIVMFSLKGLRYGEGNSMTLKDMATPFIVPVIISSVLVLIFYIIKYRKIGILEVIEYTIVGTVGIQVLLLSIYAIARIEVNAFIMPISMILYVLTFLVLTDIFEKKIKQ